MNGLTKETSFLSPEVHFDTKQNEDIIWNSNGNISKKTNLPEQILNDLSPNNLIEEAKKETGLIVRNSNCVTNSTEDTNGNVQEANFFDIFRYPNIRKKFLLLTFAWIANAVVYNGLSYNATNFGVNDFLVFFIGIIIIYKFGIRCRIKNIFLIHFHSCRN